ncbi:hypothetical protein M885DRAFT_612545, partial [Pelagophyceae sp. CCMP2097]
MSRAALRSVSARLGCGGAPRGVGTSRGARCYSLATYKLPKGLEDRLASPCLIIYAEQVRSNIRKVLEACGNDVTRWRPHVKTTKCSWVFGELVEHGVREFKCATVREAEVLATVIDMKSEDPRCSILVAMAHTGPNLVRLARCAAEYPHIRMAVLAESTDGVAEILKTSDLLGVYVDVNPPGMDRSGCSFDAAYDVAMAANDRFRGLHLYDGHASTGTAAERAPMLEKGYDALLALDARLPFKADLVTSGTPAFMAALAHAGLTATNRHAVSPGTVVFSDMACEAQVPELGLEPAALVFSRVISTPASGKFTLDAGHKAVSADAGVPTCRVLTDGAFDMNFEPARPSEEHLPVRFAADAPVSPQRGDSFYLFPRHVCPTVNLAEDALLVDGDSTFVDAISIIRIDARGHDVDRDSPLFGDRERKPLKMWMWDLDESNEDWGGAEHAGRPSGYEHTGMPSR